MQGAGDTMQGCWGHYVVAKASNTAHVGVQSFQVVSGSAVCRLHVVGPVFCHVALSQCMCLLLIYVLQSPVQLVISSSHSRHLVQALEL
jgi:hypothetical protein